MSNRTKQLLAKVLEAFTLVGGGSAIFIFELVAERSATYKISLSGLAIMVILFFVFRYLFSKRYNDKQQDLLQQLANATDPDIKEEINRQITIHKTTNQVFRSVMVVLPIILCIAILEISIKTATDMTNTLWLVLADLSVWCGLNIWDKSLDDKVKADKVAKKVAKRKEKENRK